LGFGAPGALGDEAVAALTPFPEEVPVLPGAPGDALAGAEPGDAPSVVEIGPAVPVEVSDVLTLDAIWVVDAVVLVFAAEAELVAPPLQARAARAIEMRTERYIFPGCGQR